MMRYIKHIALVMFGAVLCQGGVAQTLTSSYFLESMPMRHKLNPALVGSGGYVSIPFLGSVDIGAKTSMGMNNFLFPGSDNTLKTFMHSSVSAEQFLRGIKKRNAAIAEVDYTLLSGGFFAKSGFYTVDVSLRSTSNVTIPGELFRFMKTGMDKLEGNSYHIKDLVANTSNYVELAVGNARPITEKLTIGAKFKVLLGAAQMTANISNMDIYMSENMWKIASQGSLDAHVKGLNFKYDEEGNISGVDDLNSPGLSGWGLGIDLGATYRLIDNLTLTAAVTDLGFISWGNTRGGRMSGDPFIFEGFNDIVFDDDGSENSLDDQLDNLQSDIENLFKFSEDKSLSRRTRSLRSTIRVGAEYGILDNKISFGLLSTTRIGYSKVFTEVMVSSNFRPCNWFNAAITGSVSNYYTSWGWLLNFCPSTGLNLFVGTDYMVGKVTPQFVPVGKTSLNLSFGLNIPIRPRQSTVQNFRWEKINTRM